MEDDIRERTKSVLIDSKVELTEDSITTIVHLEDEILKYRAIIDLIKNGELIAIYEGDKTRPYNDDKLVIKKKKDLKKELEKGE